MCCVDNQILQNLKTFANDMAYLCVHALEPKVPINGKRCMGRGSNFKRGQRLVKTRMYIVGSQSRKIDKLIKKLEEWPTKYSLLEIENAQLRSYPDM